MNILLRGDAKRARDDLLDIALSLPFQTDVNTGFGILAKVYLDALTHINNRQRVRDPNAEGVKEAKQLALDICEETFPGIKNPKAEVERGFRFWDCVSTISLSPIQSPSPQVFLSLFSQNGLSEYVTDEPSSLCLYFPSFSLRFAAYAMGYSGNRLGFFSHMPAPRPVRNTFKRTMNPTSGREYNWVYDLLVLGLGIGTDADSGLGTNHDWGISWPFLCARTWCGEWG